MKTYLISIISFLVLSMPLFAQDKQAEQIIHNYLETVGSKKLWKKTQTMYDSILSSVSANAHLEKSSGGYTRSNKATYRKKSGMQKSIFYNETGVQTFYCDGKEIYMQTQRGDLMKVDDKKTIDLVEFSEVEDFIDFHKSVYKGEDYLDSISCFVVDVYHSEDTSSFVRGYFSKETSFLLKTQSYINHQPIKLYSNFDDYRELENGLVIPFLIESYNQKGDLLFKRERIKVVFDLPLKDSFFKP